VKRLAASYGPNTGSWSRVVPAHGAGAALPTDGQSNILFLDYCKTLEPPGMVPFGHEFSFESSWNRGSTGSCEL